MVIFIFIAQIFDYAGDGGADLTLPDNDDGSSTNLIYGSGLGVGLVNAACSGNHRQQCGLWYKKLRASYYRHLISSDSFLVT